jgi:hypothetical protein
MYVLFDSFFLFFDIYMYNIQNMIRVISRMIRARYEQRPLETSTIAFPFNIMKDPRYYFLFVSFCCYLCFL